MNKKWYVLYTKARNEKKTALILEKFGIEVYCPTIKEVRQWSDRKKTVEVPLFNSYIFVNLASHEREMVYDAPAVVRYLFWLNRPAVVKDKEIETLKKWLSRDVVSVKVHDLKVGDYLNVIEGPFTGKKGVIRQKSGSRVQLVLKELGIKVSINTNQIVKS